MMGYNHACSLLQKRYLQGYELHKHPWNDGNLEQRQSVLLLPTYAQTSTVPWRTVFNTYSAWAYHLKLFTLPNITSLSSWCWGMYSNHIYHTFKVTPETLYSSYRVVITMWSYSSKPQFDYFWGEMSNITYTIGLLLTLYEVIDIKHLEECLACITYTIKFINIVLINLKFISYN